MAKPSLDPIYNRLKAASGYHPSTATTFADWSVEAGDIITMTKEGEAYSTPVFASTMTWKGTPEMTTETTGKKKRESVSKTAERKYSSGSYRGATETSEWVKTIEKKTGVNEMGEGGQTLYGQIVNTGDKVGMVVGTKEGKNYIKAGEIALSINDTTGKTKAVIDADHVLISGETTVSGVMTIDKSGYLSVKKTIVVSASKQDEVISIGSGTIQAKTFSVRSTGYVRFIGSGSGEYYDLNAATVKGMVKSFSVDGNVLTLTPFYGEPINFSKATALTGAWGGLDTDQAGHFTVTAKQNGVTVNSLTEIVSTTINGTPTLFPTNDKYLNAVVDVTAKELGESGPGDTVYSSTRIINATAVYNAVTVTKVALADNFSYLQNDNEIRFSIYIQGTASNGNKKDDTQFILATQETTDQGGGVHYYVKLQTTERTDAGNVLRVLGRVSTDYVYTAGHTAGWKAAANAVIPPSGISPDGAENVFYITVPHKTTVGSTSQLTFTMTKGTPGTAGYAAVNYNNKAVARIDISNWYTDGWKEAANAVEPPTGLPYGPGGEELTSFSVGVPSKTTVGSSSALTFTMTKGTPGTSGYAAVSYNNKAVCRIDISNWYTAGWQAAANVAESPVTEDTSSNNISVYIPASVGNRTRRRYYLTKDNDYIYLRYNSPSPNAGTTVAQIANTVSVTGWNRTAFPQNTNHSLKHAFDIPIQVTVNGTEYSHTFTTPEMYLNYRKVGTVDTYELICGTTVIYRFEV